MSSRFFGFPRASRLIGPWTPVFISDSTETLPSRQACFLVLLLAIFASAQVACAGTGSDRMLTTASARRYLKGADADTEERLRILGLNKLKSVFKKTPNAMKTLEATPALVKPLQDPKFSKTSTLRW
ncbi:hypothetical protein PHYSODRAFT_286092 [Phytophthora sojae]|uniref:Uncharacterized protein n=2 Tax=Phytophthora sojae TaxID=67593 RepID=G4ZGZ5_PHYSP|nr:hypothetical protein PHYSODRAFT_286092 [Phytophthora sojae]AEK81253.1 Avh363 [Phytophthora sojae]AEK81254.1 Avh363 [Phytophthora sojae]AEK81255.1 Avh363 [Phytophthora sojae]EGZ18620.1 hypothetical protein PHYSODRAFT_286092 [Phytophthora sojae]|eukprot:XP_009527678.1 hypothetical protein PHYSODRAFT_286092 [Phytophthora sojae]